MTICSVSGYWGLFKKQGCRSLSLLEYLSHSLSPAVLCSPGLNSPPLQGGHCWSMMLRQKVVLVQATPLLTVTSHGRYWLTSLGTLRDLSPHRSSISQTSSHCQDVSSNQNLHLSGTVFLFPLLLIFRKTSFWHHLFFPEANPFVF